MSARDRVRIVALPCDRSTSCRRLGLAGFPVAIRPVLAALVLVLALSLLPTVIGLSLDVRGMAVTVGGPSVDMWAPMANAIVAGLVVATALTLVVTPVMLSSLESVAGGGRTAVAWVGDLASVLRWRPRSQRS